MTDWLQQLANLHASGEPAVLVTVAGVRGSAPREVGAKMLVTARETLGTIGGGALEYQCTRLAAERLARQPANGGLRRFPLASNCGQCCGGVVDILFEPLVGIDCLDALLEHWSAREEATLVTVMNAAGAPAKAVLTRSGEVHGSVQLSAAVLAEAQAGAQGLGVARRVDTPGRHEPFLLLEPLRDSGFTIGLFGAGHVGSALVQVLAGLNCNIRWIDSRRRIFPDAPPPNVVCIESNEPPRDVAALPAGTFYFIMTHSHALDLDITAAILRRGDFAYCGLIGSLTKRRRFEARLRKLGIATQTLQRLSCPIGIAGISGKRPQEIAIAAAADVLRRRDRQLTGRLPSVSPLVTPQRRQQ